MVWPKLFDHSGPSGLPLFGFTSIRNAVPVTLRVKWDKIPAETARMAGHVSSRADGAASLERFTLGDRDGAGHMLAPNSSGKGPPTRSSKPLAYLTDVLERITSGEAKTIDLQALLPWNWPGAGVPLR